MFFWEKSDSGTSENEKCYWYLVTIDDPDFLLGKSIYNIIKLILTKIEFHYVILEYIDGSPKSDHLGLITELQKKMGKVTDLNEIVESLSGVKQFDWGDFFLFREFPSQWDDPKGALYPHVIAQADTTVRAVDNQYIYIYTPYEEIVELIKSNYEIESLKVGSLNDLDYPE